MALLKTSHYKLKIVRHKQAWSKLKEIAKNIIGIEDVSYRYDSVCDLILVSWYWINNLVILFQVFIDSSFY